MRLNSLSLQKSEPENATGSREQANLDQVTPFVDLGIDLAGRYPSLVLHGNADWNGATEGDISKAMGTTIGLVMVSDDLCRVADL